MNREEALKSLRATLDWLGDDVKRIAAPVDPVLEATAINKAFDDGPAFLMENITGYDNARLIAGLLGAARQGGEAAWVSGVVGWSEIDSSRPGQSGRTGLV